MNDVLYLVIPCYNEEAAISYENIKAFIRCNKPPGKTEKISSESKIMFVNDGSKDKTWEIIESLHTQNPIFAVFVYPETEATKMQLLAGLMTAKRIC